MSKKPYIAPEVVDHQLIKFETEVSCASGHNGFSNPSLTCHPNADGIPGNQGNGFHPPGKTK